MESEAYDSSVSSFSTSQSLWEKGFNLPKEEAASIPTTVTVAKPALVKSNPMTQSSPRKRQAKQSTEDSPTSSVLSPMEKRHLHVEESSQDEIAITERRVP
jgi:hypothetical protein